ncbi:nuclear condensing complex subunit [Lophiotrema nucula]|uniref:Nuclear condensing complex subunit n=1 Tax=Lophiotrema nucula TaxID=690887 RepID=A0A6A5YVH6_9PLEO|nr:nuclear condensing complex subunit [Lophiotrema nucula]
MPGRPSARAGRATDEGKARKASTQTPRKSRSTRNSANAIEIPDEGPDNALRTQICMVFADAQKTTATQRKLVVNLRKIQEACCYEPQDAKKQKLRESFDFDEAEFNAEVLRCVLRVLPVKKSEPVGDRVIRFLAMFLKHATEKDNAIHGDEDEYPDTPSSRLVSHILENVMEATDKKEKTIRFRAAQTVAYVINNLDHVDTDVFARVRDGLMMRLRDKEPSVRVQAVLGLHKLVGNDEDEDEEEQILSRLMDILQNDPSADVRRTLLLNINFSTETLPWLLERARDLDPSTRRALYGKLLPVLGDFRNLRLVQREKLLRWGIRDRDEMVRKATARLFSTNWLECCAETYNPTPEAERTAGEVSPPTMEGLLELLERIDVVSSGQEGGMASEVMREFWDNRPDYLNFVTFDDDYWNDFSAESAFLLRSFNDYCQASDDSSVQSLLDDKLMEVQRIAVFMENNLNMLIEQVHEVALLEEGDNTLDEQLADREFIVEQLLHIANTLDYTDEVGRRQMFNLMKESLARPQLPEECTKLAIEALRTICGNREEGEREFCTVIQEAIAEVRDTIADEPAEEPEDANDSFHSAQSEISDSGSDSTIGSTIVVKPRSKAKKQEELDPEAEEEKRIRQIMVYLKCLHITQCMLQNVHFERDLETNAALRTMLNTLIVPAVRNPEKLIRERGLVCLGLCALLSKNLAQSNLQLFMACYTQGVGHDTLQLSALQILSDLLITYPSLLAPPIPDADQTEDDPAPVNEFLNPLTKLFIKAFKHANPTFSLTACTAVSKLLLLGILPEPQTTDVLKAFVLAYFNPEKASNEWSAVRQALSYFLPVFCHSKPSNALLMSQLCVYIVQKLLAFRDEPEEDPEEVMVGWPIIAGHLAEWTDGRRVVGATEMGLDGKTELVQNAEASHVLLATELLERALSNNCSKDERKPLLILLSKLHISPAAPSKGEMLERDSLIELHRLATEAVEESLGQDVASRNAISKLETVLTKRLGELAQALQDSAPGSADQSEVADGEATRMDGDISVKEEEEEEEDTILAGMHAEGTVLPLEDDEEEDGDGDEESTVLPVRERVPFQRKRLARSSVVAFTESDIVDELLETELGDSEV